MSHVFDVTKVRFFFTFFKWQIKVVVAMRDLFQVVFELKKKEIEDAKTMLENKEQQQQVQKSKVRLKCFKIIDIIISLKKINAIKLQQILKSLLSV